MTELLTVQDALVVLDEMHLVVADPGLLASAVGRPTATVFGQDAYPQPYHEGRRADGKRRGQPCPD